MGFNTFSRFKMVNVHTNMDYSFFFTQKLNNCECQNKILKNISLKVLRF